MVQPEVTIPQGTLRGSVATGVYGTEFFKFQGIPYAKPPLGDLRFKAPQPPEKWPGTLDATKEGDCCYARDPLKDNAIFGSEDCLFLNVYTKTLPTDGGSLSPVLFWIHGGGFVFGSGNEDVYGPDFLLTEDVVVVTINYRLGLLGFISFGDSRLDISGNAGLKDQVMALKWVQKNISKFGGDPNNVTIFGESAGGSSTHLLMLSPMGKGLFHKAIAQSGVVLNPWVHGTAGIELVASAMGLEGSNDKAVHEALMAKSVQELYEIQEKMTEESVPNKLRPLGLVIEKHAKEPFLDKEAIDLMITGQFQHVPFMVGFTTAEGMIFELHKKPTVDMIPCEAIIPWYFKCEDNTPATKILAEKIKKFYFGDEEYSQKLLSKKYDMFSDSQFLYGIFSTIVCQFHLSKSPIYLYQMSVETDLNFLKKFTKIEIPGVGHADDIGYLFKVFTTPEIKPGSLEDVSVKRFVKLWTNFARFGNPTPDGSLGVTWKPVKDETLDFLDIGKELSPMSNPTPDRRKFWEQIFRESPAGSALSDR